MLETPPPAEKPNLSARIRQLLDGNIDLPADKIVATLKREKYAESKPGSNRDAVYNVRSNMRKALKADANGKPADPAPAAITEATAEVAVPVALPTLAEVGSTEKATINDMDVVVLALKAARSAGGIAALTQLAAVCKDAGPAAVNDVVKLCVEAGTDRVIAAAAALSKIEAIADPGA